MLFGDPNSKLKNDNTKQFSIPQYKSNCGMITCPYAGECKKYCYAGEGTIYTAFPAIDCKHESNLQLYLTDRDKFISDIIRECNRSRNNFNRRIHDRGDFFNRDYLEAWYTIIDNCKKTLFYAYTKSLPLFNYQSGWVRDNLFIRFSYGGTLDHKIKSTDYKARVFQDKQAILKAGWVACPHDSDLLAFDDTVLNLGIPVHGQHKSKFKG